MVTNSIFSFHLVLSAVNQENETKRRDDVRIKSESKRISERERNQ